MEVESSEAERIARLELEDCGADKNADEVELGERTGIEDELTSVLLLSETEELFTKSGEARAGPTTPGQDSSPSTRRAQTTPSIPFRAGLSGNLKPALSCKYWKLTSS